MSSFAYDCDLAGIHSVEAGAGSGKTYNIQILVLRQLLSMKEPDLRRILVVTFTRKATAELRDRLRKVLSLMLQRLRLGRPLEEGEKDTYKQVETIYEKAADDPGKQDDWKKRLVAALANFDQANVFTIHGFCQRMLAENAFESGMQYGMALQTDLSEAQTIAANDFCRKYLQHASPEETTLFAKVIQTPDTLLSKLKDALGYGEDEVHWGDGHDGDLTQFAKDEDEAGFEQALLYRAWKAIREQCKNWKAAHGVLTYDDILVQLRERLKAHHSGPALKEAIRKRYDAVFVDEFQDTDSIQYDIFGMLFGDTAGKGFFMIGDPKQAIYKFRGGDLQTYLMAKNATPNNDHHRHSLNENYRSSAAYITQLNRFFHCRDDHFFRPLDASPNDAEEITFTDITPGDAPPQLLLNGKELDSSLLLTRMDDDGDIDVDQRLVNEVKAIMQAGLKIADRDNPDGRGIQYSDIAVLVDSNANGVAIQQVLAAAGIPCTWNGDLSLFGVQSQQQNSWGTDNTSKEAKSLRDLMEILLGHADQAQCQRLLYSPMLHLNACEIDWIVQNGLPDFQNWLHELYALWERHSFLHMFRAFLTKPLEELFGKAGAPTNQPLMRLTDGAGDSRAAAIYDQLAYELDSVAIANDWSPATLTARLNRQLDSGDALQSPEDAEDAHDFKQRKWTSQPAVSILTAHKSKGLEFSIVFAYRQLFPPIKDKEAIYHDDDGNRRYNMDPADVEVKARCQREAEAERLRLLYVVATRAKFLCRFLDKELSKENFYSNPTSAHFQEEDIPRLENFAEGFATTPDGAQKDNDTHSALICETAPSRTPAPGWRSSSYSQLASHDAIERAYHQSASQAEAGDEASTTEGKNDDEALGTGLPLPAWNERAPIFQFPGGASAGVRWHKFFELLNFQEDLTAPDWLDRLRAQLRQEALLRSEWDANDNPHVLAFGTMLKGILTQPLLPGTEFRLADLTPERRRAELNFRYWHEGNFQGELCREALARHGIAVPPGWSPRGGSSSLTGSIDLLFLGPDEKLHILDWKTNLIGCDLANFNAEGLKSEMDRNFYPLQYLIYAVGAAEYLASLGLDFDRHFGGVHYLFVRGISPDAPQRGFHHAMPPADLVAEMRTCFGLRMNAAQ